VQGMREESVCALLAVQHHPHSICLNSFAIA
jgi:hypothetical protein